MAETKSQLSPEQAALLFAQLKRLEAAGLPVDQAFAMLAKSDAKLKTPLLQMQHTFTQGRSITESGLKAGIFNDTQLALLQAGESSGRMLEVYSQLAEYYAGLDKRIKKVKSRLYFPALILVIALLVQPLPALVAQQISGFEYLLSSLGRFAVVGLGVYSLVKLPSILVNIGAEQDWHRLQWRIPWVANWIKKRQINDFFFVLALMLESGLSFQDALPKAVATIKNSCLRETFKPAFMVMDKGMSVTDTLKAVPSISNTMLQIINTSEQSGKLASGLLHFCNLEAETIALQDDALAEWLPRIIYSVIAAWMAYSILGSSVMSRIPDDL